MALPFPGQQAPAPRSHSSTSNYGTTAYTCNPSCMYMMPSRNCLRPCTGRCRAASLIYFEFQVILPGRCPTAREPKPHRRHAHAAHYPIRPGLPHQCQGECQCVFHHAGIPLPHCDPRCSDDSLDFPCTTSEQRSRCSRSHTCLRIGIRESRGSLQRSKCPAASRAAPCSAHNPAPCIPSNTSFASMSTTSNLHLSISGIEC